MKYNLGILLYALNMLSSSTIGLRVIEVSQSDYLENPRNEYQSKGRLPTDDVQQDLGNVKESLTDGKNTDDNNIAETEEPSLLETRKRGHSFRAKDCDDPKEKTLKDKIDRLVEQTIEDTQHKMATIAEVKERGKELAAYKIGFILNMVKKSREVQNELFNVAVKHRDDWKSLEQMKIFELMVHTNVDTTNLVRQMVEIHVANANLSHVPYERKRVVLLRRSYDNHTSNSTKYKDIAMKINSTKLPLTGRKWQYVPFKGKIK